MVDKDLKFVSEKLNQLACKDCTKGWLSNYDNLSEPIEDILSCYEKGYISMKLRDRLIKEVKEIKIQL